MRMWLVPVEFMCTTHRNGEHYEYHKHRYKFEKKFDMTGYIVNNCLEPMSMKKRHDELAGFMKNHNSPFEQPDLSYMPDDIRFHTVDVGANFDLLMTRCIECRKQYMDCRKDRNN